MTAPRFHERLGHPPSAPALREPPAAGQSATDFYLEEAAGPWGSDFIRITFVALSAIAVRFLPPLAADAIGLLATLIGGYPIFKEAAEALWARRMTMELSMTIGLLAALAIGQFLTALIIVFFVLIAEVLEDLTVSRGRRAIRDLVSLLPSSMSVRRDGVVREIEAQDLRTGDIVVVKPGERIAVDGVVVWGHSFVDQAAITGESIAAEKLPGAKVYAGTINQWGAIGVEPSGVGRDTAFGRIIETVESAQKSRAPVQNIADRLSGYLVYFALGCAALTFLFSRDIRATISVVIVAGACGIAAGTPLAILGAIGRAARHGAIIKGGIYLERLAQVDTVVLDKTGTLTFGNPEVVAIWVAPGVSEREILEAAATAERLSEHPLAKAILKKAAESGCALAEPARFEYFPGKGVASLDHGSEIVVGTPALLAERGVEVRDTDAGFEDPSAVLVARGSRVLGRVEIGDVLRPDAKEAVALLTGMGLRTILLTGDTSRSGRRVANEIGVYEVGAGLLPEQKRLRIRDLKAEGRRLAMVGDGINDAAALVEAQVGIAMGSGTDLARESAGIVLLGNDLLKLVATIGVARRCMGIVRANFIGTLVVDGIGLLLAAMGLLSPLLAALIHVSSELAFILNSARLFPSSAASSSNVRSREVVKPI